MLRLQEGDRVMAKFPEEGFCDHDEKYGWGKSILNDFIFWMHGVPSHQVRVTRSQWKNILTGAKAEVFTGRIFVTYTLHEPVENLDGIVWIMMGDGAVTEGVDAMASELPRRKPLFGPLAGLRHRLIGIKK